MSIPPIRHQRAVQFGVKDRVTNAERYFLQDKQYFQSSLEQEESLAIEVQLLEILDDGFIGTCSG